MENILKRYGLPTALALLLMYLLRAMVEKQTEMLSDQIEFTNRLVDTMCTPQRPVP